MSILEEQKKSILDCFVFPEIRDVQRKVLLEIEEALKTYDYIMVEAPTGSGKSLIAATVANYLGSSYINTASLLLQDQYLRDFKWMKTIKGKSNFECLDPITENLKLLRIQELRMQKTLDNDEKREQFIKNLENKTLGCHEAPCCFKGSYKCTVKPKIADYEVINEGTIKEKIIEPTLPLYNGNPVPWCQYFNQKNQGFIASHTVLNYKLFFAIYHANAAEFVERRRELLVFDEAHSIENEIMDFIGFTLSRQYLENLEKNVLTEEVLKNCSVNLKDLKFPTENLDSIDTWIAFLDKTFLWMDSVHSFYVKKMENNDSNGEIDESLISSIETNKNKLEALVSNMILDKLNWIVDIRTEFYDKTKIKDVRIYPIESGKYIRPILDICNKKLFISATLFDKEVFCRMIGVPSDKVKFIRITASPFPVEHRPIYALNLGQMSYKNMSQLLPVIASNVDSIMAKYPDEKGIIHTTSYAQCEYLLKNLSEYNKQRILVTGGHGVKQSDILKQHEASKNTVLLSPSLYQGVDLNEDLSRFQIVLKIPFPDLSDKRISLKMKRDYHWYQWQTLLRLVQSIGRSVRSENDYADTFVLDSNFKKLANSKMMPQYIRDAIIMR